MCRSSWPRPGDAVRLDPKRSTTEWVDWAAFRPALDGTRDISPWCSRTGDGPARGSGRSGRGRPGRSAAGRAMSPGGRGSLASSSHHRPPDALARRLHGRTEPDLGSAPRRRRRRLHRWMSTRRSIPPTWRSRAEYLAARRYIMGGACRPGAAARAGPGHADWVVGGATSRLTTPRSSCSPTTSGSPSRWRAGRCSTSSGASRRRSSGPGRRPATRPSSPAVRAVRQGLEQASWTSGGGERPFDVAGLDTTPVEVIVSPFATHVVYKVNRTN